MAAGRSTDRKKIVKTYYRAIDAGEYERLREVLAPDFVQERGDRTFEDREAFIRFMAEDRPQTDTTHELERLYEGPGGIAAQGQLRRADGSLFFRFVDVFEVDGRIERLVTYTAAGPERR